MKITSIVATATQKGPVGPAGIWEFSFVYAALEFTGIWVSKLSFRGFPLDVVINFHLLNWLISGVHISRVKSVNLDTWAPEQVVSLKEMGNSRARAVYEALLSDNFRRPQTDSGLESFIRAKYEHKKYIAREWIPPPPITKVDWDKEIEEELENQKRKKKSSTSSASIPEPVKSAPSPINVAIPAPLPKPHSPKNSRLEAKKAVAASSNSMDLLGLNTTSSPVASTASPAPASIPKAASNSGDGFDFFANVLTVNQPAQQTTNGTVTSNSTESSLKQEEDDFFNQKSLENGSADKGKMTKDSILALYGNAPSFAAPQAQPVFNANFQQFPGVSQDQFFTYGQQPGAPLFKPVAQQQQQPQHFAPTGPSMMFNNGNFGNFNANFGTMQTQQINKLNEENLKKIESLNFNSFK